MTLGISPIPPSNGLFLPPLCDEAGFDDPGDLVDKGDGSCDVVEHRHVSDLLPRHGHVLHQLQYSVGHVLQGSAGDTMCKIF